MYKRRSDGFGLVSTASYAVLAMSMVLMTGCGGSPAANRAAVRGKVTLDGEPVNGGRISFIPTGQGPQSGTVIKDGTYEISQDLGVAIGENRVEIRWAKETGRTVLNPFGDASMGKIAEAKEVMPPRYHETSELKASVKEGDNEVNFDLKTDAKK